jgi:hypothetical protein
MEDPVKQKQRGVAMKKQMYKFFDQIAHVEVPWRDRTIYMPVFYQDAGLFGAAFLTRLDKVQSLLPSPRMKPLRVTPWHTLTTITAYEYRDCDLGPYNEVAIGFPITVGDKTPTLLADLRRSRGSELMAYVHRLPVTTEVARDVGIEFANYPKFLAEIDFEKKDDWLRCHLSENGEHILTLSVRKPPIKAAGRSRLHSITTRAGRILRLEFISSERQMGTLRDQSGAVLQLGEHAISRELCELRLGQSFSIYYAPSFQAVLSPVIESYPAS